MRQRLAWLAALPLLLAGTQLAHALDYRFLTPNSHARVRFLEATGHGYLDYLPLALAVLFAGEVVWILLIAAHRRRSRLTRTPLPAWPFALLPPLTFAVQEHLERWLHTGVFPWSAVLEATFLPGLLLQLPFGLLAYFLARLLLGLADELVAWLEGSFQPARGRPPGSRPAPAPSRPRRRHLANRLAARGPPLTAPA